VDVTERRASSTGSGGPARAPAARAATAALRRLQLLDAPPQEAFDRVTRLLAAQLRVPVALLSLLDGADQLLVSQVGLGEPRASLREIPLASAISQLQRARDGGEALVVCDARSDARLALEEAIADSDLLACAGMPLLLEGEPVGALWAADQRAREWSEKELQALADLAAVAERELELRSERLDRVDAQASLLDNERRMRLAFDAASVAVVMTSLNQANAGRILFVNRAFCEFLGRPEDSLLGAHVREITHPDDVPVTEQTIAAMVSGEMGNVTHLEKRYLHARGHTVWGALTTSGVIPGDGERRYVVSLVEDITDHKQAELDLPAIANVLRRILSGEDARQAIVQAAVDIAGATSAHLAERAAPQLLTVTASARLNLVGVEIRLDAPSATANTFLSGQQLFLSDPGEDPLVSPQLLELSRARSILWQPIFSHEGVIGVLCVCWGERVADVSARAARAVALLTDETAVALAHHDALERLAAQATTDPLTSLPNRRAWDERLSHDLAAARRTGHPITLALLDMDRFKHYNDTRGHAAGDELLCHFADGARGLLREGDTLARWGGEEFAILLPDCPSASFAQSILDRIRTAVPAGQSCSIGYATWDGLESAAELVKRADRALYRAKAMGRDRAACADAIA